MKAAMFWVNGEPEETVTVRDRALQYGDGLFETILVSASRPEFLQQHMARLRYGCERLKLNNVTWSDIETEISALAGQCTDGVLKVILTRGVGERGYRFDPQQPATRILALFPSQARPKGATQSGIRVHLCETRLAIQPALAGVKHLNRLEQVLARSEWDDPDIGEGLMLDSAGYLIEGTMSNLFLVRNGELLTPRLSSCGVAGVMRSVILDLAERNGIRVKITSLTLEDAKTADEVFVCNSLIGIRSVTSIDRIGHYAAGPVTSQLIAALRDLDGKDHGNWYST